MIISLINEFSFRAKLVFYLGTQQGKLLNGHPLTACSVLDQECLYPPKCTTLEPLLLNPTKICIDLKG